MALKPICFASPCESPSTSSQSAGNRIRRTLQPGPQRVIAAF